MISPIFLPSSNISSPLFLSLRSLITSEIYAIFISMPLLISFNILINSYFVIIVDVSLLLTPFFDSSFNAEAFLTFNRRYVITALLPTTVIPKIQCFFSFQKLFIKNNFDWEIQELVVNEIIVSIKMK